MALNAMLDFALGNTTMGVLVGVLAIALFVRAWLISRAAKPSLPA